jgi:hypothetical protein
MEHILGLPDAYDQYVRADASRMFLKELEFSRLEFECVQFRNGVL